MEQFPVSRTKKHGPTSCRIPCFRNRSGPVPRRASRFKIQTFKLANRSLCGLLSSPSHDRPFHDCVLYASLLGVFPIPLRSFGPLW